MTLCIKNARHLDAPVDLLVRDGKIVTMTPAGHHAAPEGSQIVDARGLILMPSMVDAHVHLREPGFEYKEDINTGLEAAARGGFGDGYIACIYAVGDCRRRAAGYATGAVGAGYVCGIL